MLTALEKLPADRFASAADFAAALAADGARSAQQARGKDLHVLAGLSGEPLRSAPLPWRLPPQESRLWNWKTNPRAAPPVIRRAEFTMAGQFEVGGAQVAASADGRTIATTDGGQLVVRRVDRLELITVPGSAGAVEPFLSADGTPHRLSSAGRAGAAAARWR